MIAAPMLQAAGTPPNAPRILFSDEVCIIADKPAGQLSVPGRGPLASGSLAQQLCELFTDALIVHRLDMATSGVILFGRGKHWQRHFSAEFAQRRVDKTYVAMVQGRLGGKVGDCGAIDLPLAADWPNRPRQQVDHSNGRPSLTQWRVLAHDPHDAWTRLALTPVTGRSHQLRVHLLSINHPIIGDGLYGSINPTQPEPRLMLHACALGLQHPTSGKRLLVESNPPF